MKVGDVCPAHGGDRVVVKLEEKRYACMHHTYASVAKWHVRPWGADWDGFLAMWRTIGITYATEENLIGEVFGG